MTKARHLLFVVTLFFASSQAFQQTNKDTQTVVGVDKYNAFISFFDHKTLEKEIKDIKSMSCLLYTSPSPRDVEESRMPSSA